MQRGPALFAGAQALLFAGLAAWLSDRSLFAAGALGVASAAQVGALVQLARGRRAGLGSAGLISLLGVGAVAAMLGQVALYLRAHVAPADAREVWIILGVVAIAAPWLVAVPLWQILAASWRWKKAGAGALIAVITLPLVYAERQLAPTATFASVDGPLVAKWLHNRCAGRGEQWMLPEQDGPVRLGVTLIRDGDIVAQQTVAGDDLAAALTKVTLKDRRARVAVLLDMVREQGPLWTPALLPAGWLWLRVGDEVPSVVEGALASSAAWHTYGRRRRILPGLPVPALTRDVAPSANEWARVDSVLATQRSTTPLRSSWAIPPALDADTAYRAALNAGIHLAREQAEDGRFTYQIEGPSGLILGGYNYPRHAGVAWFLARLARRSDNERVWIGARAGVRHLESVTQTLADGRRFVLDPTRHDGEAWIGTTALATLAAITLGDEDALADAWLAQVIASVDEAGQARGEFNTETGLFSEQPPNPYAQGQVMLALAVALRAERAQAEAPLLRAAAYVDGAYWPALGGAIVTLDEHWMCLAALASDDAIGTPAGLRVCDAYLREAALTKAPQANASSPMGAGSSGALAEAFAARAALAARTGAPPPFPGLLERFGDLFLASQYDPGERPFFGHTRLFGAFRETPYDLTAHMDTAQHVGCALLGIEASLRGHPLVGSLP